MFKKLINTKELKELTITDDKCSLYTKKYLVTDITNKRDKIYRHLLTQFNNNVCNLNSSDILSIIKLYDDEWFQGDLLTYLKSKNYPLNIKIDDTIVNFTTESICLIDKCSYTIYIPLKKISKTIDNQIIKVGGINCKNELQALQVAIEHELVHLIIFMFCGSITISDEHGELFQNTSKQLFGHTEIYHHIF